MSVSGISSGLFTAASAGVLGALLLAPFEELRRFFFVFNSSLALVFLLLGLPFRPLFSREEPVDTIAWWAAISTIVAMGLIVLYIVSLYLPGGYKAWPILGLATAASFMATTLDGWAAGGEGGAAWIFGANSVAAALLLGTVIVTTTLGHWYLVRWRLPVIHLIRFSLVLAGAIALRAILLVAGLLVYGAGKPGGIASLLHEVAVDRGFFFWQRIAVGIVGPAVFAWMVYATARIRSTQSATGILYLTVIFVLIGEFLARFLMVTGAGPM
ncbi:MAG: hypothetical protein O7A63_06150 [Acidobacteria bacterium]|nr:hypothetical protein [Acidobacteriota bacterium]